MSATVPGRTQAVERPDATGVRRDGNVLVVTWLCQRHRGSTLEMLYSFERWSRARCFYLNTSVRRLPRWTRVIDFDLVIFDPLFLISRWIPEVFERLCRRVAPLRHWPGVKVALPQDEYLDTDALNRFINEFGVDHVFSCAAESEWPRIYPRVDRQRTGFTRVLPGYLENGTLERIEQLDAAAPERPIDIGYRARPGFPWTGRHGRLKSEVASAFTRAATNVALKLDVSTDERDTFYGDDWLKFLLRCKYSIGVEGGSSILNAAGQTILEIMRYMDAHPESTPDEIEARFLAGREGSVDLRAISPRHLEACATRTCQVLVEGDYSGVLRQHEHYIPLRRDLSNVDEVVAAIVRDDRRAEITAAAHRDIVASGAYSYRAFVATVERVALGSPLPQVRAGVVTLMLHAWSRAAHRMSDVVVAVRVRVAPPFSRLRVRAALGRRTAAVRTRSRRLLRQHSP
jgi:hypothetical protein